MHNKFLALALLVASSVLLLPILNYGAADRSSFVNTDPPTVQTARQRLRRTRRRERRIERRINRRHRRRVRRLFRVNGHRVYRWVWIP